MKLVEVNPPLQRREARGRRHMHVKSAIQRAGALDRAERHLTDAIHAVNKATEALAEAGRNTEADRVERLGDKLATWRNWVSAS